MTKLSGVYQIANKANGKIYVGSTGNIPKRWNKHLSRARNGEHENRNLQNAFNEHGEDCFIFSVLEECDKSLLLQREQFYLDTLKPEYNLCLKAGSPLGMKRTQEARDKMSAAQTQMTQETKAKLSAVHMGKKHTQETRDKISLAKMGNTNWLGRKHTQETKDKTSIAVRAFWERLKQTKVTHGK